MKKLISKLEETNISFPLWMAALGLIIGIRAFIEYAATFHSLPPVNSFLFLHFPEFFISLLLSISIILGLFSGTSIIKTSRICLFGFLIILFPPLFDLCVSAMDKNPFTYTYVQDATWQSFLAFLNPFHQLAEVPYGIRIEIMLVTLASFLYLFSKESGLIRSILGSGLIFLSCFFHIAFMGLFKNFLVFIFPALTYIFRLFNPALYRILDSHGAITGTINYRIMSIGMTICLLSMATLWYALYDKHKLYALLKNIRPNRCLHYIFLSLIGVIVYFPTVNQMDIFVFIKIISMLLALFFAFQFSIIINDIFDIETDKITNPVRPLIAGSFNKKEYLTVGWIYLAFSLLCAFWVGDHCLILTLDFIIFYSLYSIPPFRLKRFLPISSIIIGIQALLAFLLGALSFSSSNTLNTLQLKIPLLIFLIFSLSSNIKDLKDSEGDKVSGIHTIPVIWGISKGRKIIGVLVFLSYMLVPFFMAMIPYAPALFILSLLFGLMNYLYLRKEGSRENLVFYLYFSYLFLLAAGYHLMPRP